jgi:hypothetical protein
MAGVRGDIALSIDLTDASTGDLNAAKSRVDISKTLSLLAGTDATNKANILFSDTRTVALSANENIDLSGALTDAFGASIVAAEIVAIYIEAAAANVNNVQVTRPASNGFIGPFLAASDGVSIKPGEYALFVSQSGWAVTAATGDLLNIANSGAGTGVDYNIVIVGRTVAA